MSRSCCVNFVCSNARRRAWARIWSRIREGVTTTGQIASAALSTASAIIGYDLHSGWLSTEDNPNAEEERKARDQLYRNQLAQKIFQYSGGQLCLASILILPALRCVDAALVRMTSRSV